jgi:lipoprotein-anchoring transpeptidase ErfK/SrfK
MARKLVATTRTYIYIVPLLFLLGLGVLSRTARTITPVIVDAPGCTAYDLSGQVNPLATVGIFDNQTVSISPDVLADAAPSHAVLGIATPSDRWIEVDLSEQKLRAWNGKELYLETSISSGLARTPTPVGEFHVWMKIRATKMEGGEGKYYYNLPNVPYVMFFENDKTPAYLGFGLHGTYWHHDFGTPHSHGCVNLPTDMAHVLYEWTTPTLPDGKNVVRADADNPGTRIVIHE